jgi:hypothetical protein
MHREMAELGDRRMSTNPDQGASVPEGTAIGTKSLNDKRAARKANQAAIKVPRDW